jgi:beta-lactamase regulating signal transducer with metallopeptidase domain/Leucine-rich repeat (LRR) protein
METSNLIDLCASWIWRASWQASVLAFIVLAVQWLFSKRLAPAWRYGLWFVIVARLCWPISLPSPVSVFNYARIDRTSVRAFELLIPDPEPTRDALGAPAASVAAQPSVQGPTTTTPTPSLKPQRSIRSLLAHGFSWLWLGVVAVLTIRLVWNNCRFARRLGKRPELNDPIVRAVLDECRRLIGVSKPLKLVEAPEVDSPALFGFLRLKLLLPRNLSAHFSPAELRHILLHELAHVRRRDVLANWVTTVLQIIHWFNPILWLAFNRMRADCETACDALALACADPGENRRYGQTMIKLLENFNGPRKVAGMVGILEDKRQMKQRLRMIATFSPQPKWSLLAAAVIACFGIVALTDAQTKQQRADSEIIAEIEKFGGKITYDETQSDRPIIGVAFEGNDRFNFPDSKQVNDDLLRALGRLSHVTELILLSDRCTDDGLVHLERLTKLKTLKLRWTAVSGTGLRHLKNASRLKELYLMGTKVSDDGLTNLQHFPNLETLDLGRGDKITNLGLTNLSVLQKLRTLRFHLGSPAGDALTAEGFRHLAGLTNLQTLGGIGRPGTVFGDEALAYLRNLVNLTNLNLGTTRVTDAGFDTLKDFPKLKFLSVARSQVTDAGLSNLKHFPDLETLHLGGPNQATDTAIDHLKLLPKLKRVFLGVNPNAGFSDPMGPGKITDAGVKTLASLHLEIVTDPVFPTGTFSEKLFLEGATITDSTLAALRQLSKLTGLRLHATNVTDSGLAYLKNIPGLETVHITGNQFTDAALLSLKDVSNLRELTIHDAQISDAGLVYLKDRTQLRLLSVKPRTPLRQLTRAEADSGVRPDYRDYKYRYPSQISDAGLIHVKGLTNLTELDLSASQITDSGLLNLAGLAVLDRLNLSDTEITDAGVAQLSRLPRLRLVYLDRTRLTSDALRHFEALSNLGQVGVNYTEIGDDGLRYARNWRKSASLQLRGTRVTGEAIASLKKDRPDMWIQHESLDRKQ